MKTFPWIKTKYLFILLLTPLSKWVVALGIVHLIYFFVNLSQILSLEVEKNFLIIYPMMAVGGIVHLIVFCWSKSSNLVRDWENDFDLNFQWVNLLKEYGKPRTVPKKIFVEMLENISFHKLYLKNRFWWAMMVFTVVGWLGAMYLFSDLQREFEVNLQSVRDYTPLQYNFEYSKEVKEGDDFKLSYEGDYPKASFRFNQNKLLEIKSGDSWWLSNFSQSIQVDYQLEYGRSKDAGKFRVQLLERPKVENISLIVQHQDQRELSYQGVYSLQVEKGSLVVMEIDYQTDQLLKRGQLVQIPEDTIVEDRVRTLRQLKSLKSLRDNGELVVLTEAEVKENHLSIVVDWSLISSLSGVKTRILVENDLGQLGLSEEFELVVRKNLPPQIEISKPDRELRMVEPEDVVVEWTAEDDLGVRQVVLSYRIRRSGTGGESSEPLVKKYSNFKLSPLIKGTHPLPIKSINTAGGATVEYFLMAVDGGGLRGYSSTNHISFITPDKLYQKNLEQGEILEGQIGKKKELIDNLENEFDKLKILSEQKKVEESHIQSFKENLDEVYDQVQKDIGDLEEYEQEKKENDQVISQALQKKLLELKKALESLDNDFLQKMQKNSDQLLKKMSEENLSEKELQNFFNDISTEKISKNVDQILNAVKNWRKLQKIDSLEKLANNLYLRFKDLESYILAGLLKADDVKLESGDIADQLSFIGVEFKSVEEDLLNAHQEGSGAGPGVGLGGQSSVVKKLVADITKRLDKKEVSRMRQVARKMREQEYLKGRSENLDYLRKGLFRLNNLNQDLDGEALLYEINYQIISISERVSWMNKLIHGESYDLSSLSEDKKRSLLVLLISKQQTMLLEFKESLFLLSSSMLLELDFLDFYEESIPMMEKIKKNIDPASQIGGLKKIKLQDNVWSIKQQNSVLAVELIRLKEWVRLMLKEAQKNRAMERAQQQQQNLNQRINDMLNKPNLSQAEKDYLKQLAVEQSFIRSLMEQAERDQRQIEQKRKQLGTGWEKEYQSGAKQKGGNNSERGKSIDSGQKGKAGKEGKEGKEKKAGEGKNGKDGKSGEKKGQGENGEGNGEDGSDKEVELKQKHEREYSKRLKKLVEKMNQMQSELASDNIDLERVKELKEKIEKSLEFTKSILKQDEDKGELSKRTRELDDQQYQMKASKLKEKDRYWQEKLRKVRLKKIDSEYRERIESFYNSQLSP